MTTKIRLSDYKAKCLEIEHLNDTIFARDRRIAELHEQDKSAAVRWASAEKQHEALEAELLGLRAQVARLQAELSQAHRPATPAPARPSSLWRRVFGKVAA